MIDVFRILHVAPGIDQPGEKTHIGVAVRFELVDRRDGQQVVAVRVGLLHGDDGALLRGAIGSGDYDMVCYGHTHVALKERHRKTLALNPGALYRAQPHSLAVVRLPELEATHIEL